MKTIFSSVLLSLATSLVPCPAQEANPYLERLVTEAPAPPSGDSFLTLTEHIIVPADLLDSWVAAHPEAQDFSELRAAAQGWIHEGKATLDHSALSAGTVGREYNNESILEQIYATEWMPAPSPEDWTVPTAFECRNLGYTSGGDAVRKKGGLVIREMTEVCRMLPHPAPDKVSEETRQPGDIFTPRFHTTRISQTPRAWEDGPNQEFDPDYSHRKKPVKPSYPAGTIHLVSRADDDLPEPVILKSPNDTPKEAPKPLPANRPVRLIFVRSDMTGSSPEKSDPLPTDYQVSGKLISVDHQTLSDWLQGRDLATASSELGEAIEKWNEDGKVKILRHTSGGGRSGTRTSLQDVKEVIYPTEYEPGERPPGPEGKPTDLEHALATSFETRHVGSTLITEIDADEGGPLIHVNFERVLHGGFSTHHRILRNGEWVSNVTFPLFSDNRWTTHLRLKRGEWMLVGSGSAFGENSQFDPTRIVLAFVKVE